MKRKRFPWVPVLGGSKVSIFTKIYFGYIIQNNYMDILVVDDNQNDLQKLTEGIKICLENRGVAADQIKITEASSVEEVKQLLESQPDLRFTHVVSDGLGGDPWRRGCEDVHQLVRGRGPDGVDPGFIVVSAIAATIKRDNQIGKVKGVLFVNKG